MTLRRLGFFRELPHGDPEGGSLIQSMGTEALPNEARIVEYLQGAAILVATSGPVEDVLDPSAGNVAVPNIATDGTWMWPMDLPYYVERYHVSLPEEFLAHGEATGWRLPNIGDEDLNRLADAEYERIMAGSQDPPERDDGTLGVQERLG